KSGAPWDAAPYAQIDRIEPLTKRSFITTNVENYAFHGPAIRDETGKYRKVPITDSDNAHLDIKVKDGWIAALQHHFVGVVVPPSTELYEFTMRVKGQEYVLNAQGPMSAVPAGQSAQISQTLYVGPKLQAQLERTGTELKRVADYGKLYILAA